MSTESDIRRMLADLSGESPADIHLSSRLGSDLGLDSLDATELAINLEEQFEIDIPDEQLEQFRDPPVEEVIAFVEGKLNEQRP